MERKTLASIDSNRAILISLLLVATWAFVTAFSFPDRDQIYPQLASGIVIVGTVLLLAAELFPDAAGRFSRDPEAFFDTGELQEQEEEEVNPVKRYKLIASMGVYLIAGQLVGLLWATPLFVLLHTVWTNQSKFIVAFLTGLSFVIAYVFMTTLHLSIDSGILTEVVFGVA